MTETSWKRFEQDYPPDFLTVLAMLYLALPLFIFFLGWFKWPLGLLLGGVAAMGLARPLSVAFFARNQTRILQPRILLILGFVAICWSAMGGAGHFFFANFDWNIRDAVLRDLVVSPWPPVYGQSGHGDMMLRAPVAYYLPAAVFGWALGLQFADLALWFWTALGTGLFLALLPLPPTLSFRFFASLSLVILFSGMDILGWLTVRQSPPALGEHIEWWALFFQYSSNTTQLFWVPNHALPAWIAIAIFFRHWKHPEFYNFVPITLALLPLCPPLRPSGYRPFIWLGCFHTISTSNGILQCGDLLLACSPLRSRILRWTYPRLPPTRQPHLMISAHTFLLGWHSSSFFMNFYYYGACCYIRGTGYCWQSRARF